MSTSTPLPHDWWIRTLRNGRDPALVEMQIRTYGWTVEPAPSNAPRIERKKAHHGPFVEVLGASLLLGVLLAYLGRILSRTTRKHLARGLVDQANI